MRKLWKLLKAVVMATTAVALSVGFVLMIAWSKGLLALLVMFSILVWVIYERMD